MEYYVEKHYYQYTLQSAAKRKGFVPKENCEIFVKQLPADATIMEVAKFFESVDVLYEIRLMMHPNFNRNRGFCYVTYMNPQAASEALKLQQVPFRENQAAYLKISMSFNNRRIFLGNIPVELTKDEIWRELLKAGCKCIVDIIMYRSYTDRLQNRGYVFVEFRTHEQAAYFRAKYNSTLNINGRKIVVDWSVPYPEVDDKTMKSVKKLYLRNLPADMPQYVLKQMINNVYPVSNIQKIYKFKNYAFIHLNNREDAEELFKELTEFFSDDDVEVTWAKPSTAHTSPEYRKQLIQKVTFGRPATPTQSSSPWSYHKRGRGFFIPSKWDSPTHSLISSDEPNSTQSPDQSALKNTSIPFHYNDFHNNVKVETLSPNRSSIYEKMNGASPPILGKYNMPILTPPAPLMYDSVNSDITEDLSNLSQATIVSTHPGTSSNVAGNLFTSNYNTMVTSTPIKRSAQGSQVQFSTRGRPVWYWSHECQPRRLVDELKELIDEQQKFFEEQLNAHALGSLINEI